ncbi:MAG: CHASE2 domain-containing protein [Desulfobacterales bacterium]
MKQKKEIHPLTISLIAIAAVVFIFLAQFPFLHRIELETLDLRFRFRGEKKTGDNIVLAVVDEKSIREQGKWIWPRHRFADLINRLSDAGAKVIAFDIGFLEADRNDQNIIETLEKVGQQLKSSGSLTRETENFMALLKAQANADQILADAIRKAKPKIVLGYFFHTGLSPLEHPAEEDFRIQQENIAGSEYKIKKMSPDFQGEHLLAGILPQSNIKIVSDSSEYSGHFNMEPDSDGVIRFIPLVVRFRDSFYAPLSLMTAGAWLDAPAGIQVDSTGVRSIRIGTISIPTDSDGRMFINYRGGEGTFPHISVTDILHGRVPAERFRDKIVMVGVTAIGIYDMRVVPFDNVFPGLEIHANAVDNILSKDFLKKPDWMFLFDIAGLMFSGMLLGLLLPRMSMEMGTVTVFVLFSGYILLAQYLFSAHGLIITLIYPLLLMLILYTGITVYHFFRESRQKKFIKDAFSHYLAPSVVKKLIESPENLELGGEERHITAFFSDLQGFTGISEKLTPSEIRDLLNEFLTEMTDIILKYEGTVDKFEGDAIIAFFGAPNQLENHAKVACKAGIDMQKRLAELRKKWREEQRPELKMRIGMNTGMAVVGNMGSKNRMDYTMIGDTVNTAARLEGMNKVYGTYTLISQFTCKEAGQEILTRELDMVSLVGKKDALKIYEVMGYPEEADENLKKTIGFYADGIAAYREMNWEKAIDDFENALKLRPDDAPSRIMLERCREFKENPPDANWGGVYAAKSK